MTTVPAPEIVNTRSTNSRARSSVGAGALGEQLVERRPEVVEALAGLGRDADDAGCGQGGAFDALPDLFLREVEGVLVDEVALRQRDDAARDAKDVQDREMLLRLLTPSLVRGDDEQDQSDRARRRRACWR